MNILAKESHPKWLKISVCRLDVSFETARLSCASEQNKRAIRGVVCILAQGIEPSALGLPIGITETLPQPLQASNTTSRSLLPVFQRLFSHYCPTRAPGDAKHLHSVVQTLLNGPVPENEKSKGNSSRDQIASSTGSSDPALYLLSPDQLLENGYILPTYNFDIATRARGSLKSKDLAVAVPFERWQRSDGLIETPQGELAEVVSPPLLRILGIDCEMVRFGSNV